MTADHPEPEPLGSRAEALAGPSLLVKLEARGFSIDQSEDARAYLDLRGANAATFLGDDLILRLDARKIEVIEEYLHNVQRRVSLTSEMSPRELEIHVKAFMIRHRKLLGISGADAAWLGRWLDAARGR
jgi:hypothetical protein